MAEKAIAIAELRNSTIQNLNNTIINSNSFKFPKAEISVIGEIENLLLESKASEVEDYFKNILKQRRQEDSYNGRTKNGVHLSDFRVVHNQKSMPAELCSQGEQKAMLLSIAIAAVITKKNFSGITPILLLDEVYAHLDEEKRTLLYNFINDVKCQTWLTGTEEESFNGLKPVQYISL